MSALPEPPNRLTLEEAIEQQINIGEKDPLSVARKLASLYGPDWVAEELASHWEEILSEIARQKLGNARRSAVMSITQVVARADGTKPPTKRDVVLTSLFIPKKGHISFGDATQEDLAQAAAYRRRLAAGLGRWADWIDAVRDKMVGQGADRVRDMKGEFPPLPKPELEGGA